jgi:hypothetical protein
MENGIKELAAALVKAQGEINSAEFDATNPAFKSRYATLGSIIKAVRPALAKYGLAVIQPVTTDETHIIVDTILIHESGEILKQSLSLPMAADTSRNFVQQIGSTITYIRRYALASFLGVYADEDDDGNTDIPKRPEEHLKEIGRAHV